MKKNILITGGCGFIGSWFISNFSNKYNIKVLDTMFFNDKSKLHSQADYIQKDIRNIESKDLDGVEIVVHMAELSNDPLGEINSDLTKEINVMGTQKLLKVCEKSNVKKFVYMSSCSVYGDSGDLYASEESPVNPLTNYAKAKIKNEKLLLENEYNFQIKILRNATAFGYSKNTRSDLVINDLTLNAVGLNKINVLSDGTPRRPFVHIGDISRFIDYLITYDSSQKLLINVGSKNFNYTVKNIAEIISDITKVQAVSFGVSDGDSRSYFVDFSKLEKLFPNFEFIYDIKIGVKELMNNYDDIIKNNENNKRIKKINQLIQNGDVDDKLFWRKSSF